MILLLTSELDQTPIKLIEMLNFYREDWYRLNVEDIPKKSFFNFKFNNNKSIYKSEIINSSGIPLDLKKIKSIWNRETKGFRQLERYDSVYESFIANECVKVFEGLSKTCEKATWMNKHNANISASNVILQLLTARECGFEIPMTIITQSQKELLDFYNANNGKIITKVIQDTGLHFYKLPQVVTTRINKEDINNPSLLVNCPTLFQNEVDSELELRVTVVGSNIYPAIIDSSYNKHPSVDVRLNKKADIYPFEISDELRNNILKFMKSLDLIYGALDILLTKAGKYCFLEVNPYGQWSWIEEKTGLDITEGIVNFLINKQ